MKLRNKKTGLDGELYYEPDKEYQLDELFFKTIRAYNTKANYHPKEKKYLGYNLLLNNTYYYIMGDTNRTKETDQVKTDICFVPIGGTYTMDVEEAANYINDLNPKEVIPIHYGKIVGDESLGEEFKKKIKDNIKVTIYIGGK